MNFWSSFDTLLGPLLLFWELLFLFGTARRFASRISTWRLLVSGHAAGLVTDDCLGDAVVQDEKSAPVVVQVSGVMRAWLTL